MPNLATIAVQLSLFALYGSATCIGPYLGTYLIRYKMGTPKDVGFIETLSSTLGIIIRLTICSMADRYGTHRIIYLLCTFLFLITGSSLMIPIFFLQSINEEDNGLSTIEDQKKFNLTTETTTTTTTTTTESSSNVTTESSIISAMNDELTSSNFQLQTTKMVASDLFYFVTIIIVINQLSQKVIMNLSDAFCANIALKANSSYSSIRFWGAVGRTSCAFILIFVNEIKPFLVPSLTILTILSTLNVLIIAFWPNKKQFDLSEENVTVDNHNDNNLVKFSYKNNNFWPIFSFYKNKTNLMPDLPDLCSTTTTTTTSLSSIYSSKINTKDLIRIKSLNLSNKFDTREEDLFRNIRRCSLAPLGDSFTIKKFELDNKNHTVKHFNHVTKIEPILASENKLIIDNKDNNNNNNNGLIKIKTIDLPTNSIDLELIHKNSTISNDDNSRIRRKTFEWQQPSCLLNNNNNNQLDRNSINNFNYNDESSNDNNKNNYIDLKLYLRIIMMIGFRNKLFIRFMLLYIINGMIAAVNWSYLFPYLYLIDKDKFNRLSAYVMISRYLTETIFYSIAAKYFKSINQSNSLSLILLIYGIRYLPYPFLEKQSILPLESIILIEGLRAFNMGWFNCVSNEAAIKFALEAEKCVPELIKLGFIENNKKTIDKVNNGFKATMVVISACCFDGLGLGLGSFIGGHIIELFGYKTLWFGTASFSIFIAFFNWFISIVERKNNYPLTNEKIQRI